MISYSSLYGNCQTLAKNTNATILTLFKDLINDTQNTILGMEDWWFAELTGTRTTIDGTANYKLPAKMRAIESVIVTVSSQIYRPKPIEDSDYWNYLQSLNYAESDVPQYYFRQGNDVYLWPTPATTGSTITIRGTKRMRDMSRADYNTGTITTLPNADETVTGSGSSWTTATVGTHIRVNRTAGDYEWYEIASITDTTHLELVMPYEGASIAAGSATYTIGEFSIIPSEYHSALMWRPLALYYTQNEDDAQRSQIFWRQYDGGYEAGLSRVPGGMVGKMLKEADERNSGVQLDNLQAGFTDINNNPTSINSLGSW